MTQTDHSSALIAEILEAWGVTPLTLHEIALEYRELRNLPDGRLIGIKRLMFHWTIHVDIDPCGYYENYCFATYELAKTAFDTWNGTGDPVGWHRHPRTGRRVDETTGEVYISW